MFTKHGHHIPGTLMLSARNVIKNCGGLNCCGSCIEDAEQALKDPSVPKSSSYKVVDGIIIKE